MKVFPQPAVAGVLNEYYVEARLHADGQDHIERIKELQAELAHSVATPLYLIVDPRSEQELERLEGAASEARFRDFLVAGEGAPREKTSGLLRR